jgi:hypothetical protein
MPHTFRIENAKRNVISSGLRMVLANKRYLVWFWLLNLFLAIAGSSPFRASVHPILDHSLYSEGLTQGFRLAEMFELFARPEFGATRAIATPAAWAACLFFLATALFLPGVFAGYASTYRLPREDFFRACARALWRFVRLMIIAAIVMGVIAGLLFWASNALVDKAGESTNERLPFTIHIVALLVIFLIMTTLRIWFDLAEADIVLNDQRAARRSIASAFRHTFRSIGRLLASYVVTTIVAAIVLVVGIWCWIHLIPSNSITRAFLLMQFILFSLLIPRFWQRAIAVSYWQEKMLVPVVEVHPIEPAPVVTPAVPEPSPVIPTSPAEFEGS